MITVLIIDLIFLYILAGLLIALIASFCGVKFNNFKNILLIVFYPIGVWFLK